MSDILEQLYNECDPFKSAENKYYTDLSTVRESTLYTDTTPIPFDAAERAVLKAVPSYSVGVSDAKWGMLAELETSANQQWDTENEEKLRLMESLFVLEYVNGSRAQDRFNKAKPWYAVHPIARELNDFQDAVRARNKAATP